LLAHELSLQMRIGMVASGSFGTGFATMVQ
jgi:hypothetical protein